MPVPLVDMVLAQYGPLSVLRDMQKEVAIHMDPETSPDWVKEDIQTLAREVKHTPTLRIEQRSPQWFQTRSATTTTASSCYQFISTVSDPSGDNAMCNTVCNMRTSAPLNHGTVYEECSLHLYRVVMGVDVAEVGCKVSHNRDICASPDGLVMSLGRVLELKSPFSDYATKLKPEYMYQVQTQLGVFGVRRGDFLSARFEEYATIDHMTKDVSPTNPALTSSHNIRGCHITIINRAVEMSMYKHRVVSMGDSVEGLLCNLYREIRSQPPSTRVMVHFWWLSAFYIETIPFDQSLYSDIIGKIRAKCSK